MSRMDQEPDYGEPPYEPTPEEQEGDAWHYWHDRAHKAETEAFNLRELIKVLLDNDPSEPIADNGMTVLDGWRERARRVLSSQDHPAE